MTPKRIQRKRTKGWKMPPNTLYVGRPTGWGNPFRIGNISPEGIKLKTASMAVERFERWCKDNPTIALAAQNVLRGKNLACWCKEGEPCHADVLLRIANQ